MIDCQKAIDCITTSWAKCEIVRLLRENPYVMDNLTGMSRWLALAQGLIESDVDELVVVQVLRKYGKGQGAVYGYTRNPDVKACIDDHWTQIEQARTQLRRRQLDEV